MDRLNNILQKEEKDVDELRELARSEGGLVISKQHNILFSTILFIDIQDKTCFCVKFS